MKCENCGNEVREGAKFCSKCGSNILEQQEDHSGKHNVHETKTEKRCVNCGNVLRERSMSRQEAALVKGQNETRIR